MTAEEEYRQHVVRINLATDREIEQAMQTEYVYRWNRHGRKGQRCVVTARGTMNSCAVRFVDGYTMITSRNALMKAKQSRA